MRRAGLCATGSNCGLSRICGDKIAPVTSGCGGLGEPNFRRDLKKGLRLWLVRGAHMKPHGTSEFHVLAYREAVQESPWVFFRIFD